MLRWGICKTDAIFVPVRTQLTDRDLSTARYAVRLGDQLRTAVIGSVGLMFDVQRLMEDSFLSLGRVR